jgi:excisionase family DNA binding protein
MKVELDDKDYEAIASRVAEKLRYLLNPNDATALEDTVLDVKGLARYLKVKEGWVYQRLHSKEIPHVRVGRYPRFRKQEIDKWLGENGRKPTRKTSRSR